MRLLIHYVGDVHQPLHATSRVDHEYPQGDFGGNTVKLPSHDGVTELHALWDSVAYEFSGYPKLPFSASAWKTNGDRANLLLSRHPLSSLTADTTDLNPQHWANESFKISEDFVYNGIVASQPLPSGYQEKAQSLAEERIVTAGYRLANVIMALNLPSSSDSYLLIL